MGYVLRTDGFDLNENDPIPDALTLGKIVAAALTNRPHDKIDEIVFQDEEKLMSRLHRFQLELPHSA